MSDSKDLIAEYLAKGGAVTRVDAGERTMDNRAMRKAVRGEPSENDLIAERHVRNGAVFNGLGEFIGYV